MLAYYFLFLILPFSYGTVLAPEGDRDWHTPGCHKVGKFLKSFSLNDCLVLNNLRGCLCKLFI